MKIIRREKACFRKVQGERWGVKFESFEAGNVYVAEVDVDSNDKEALKKIDDELYKLAKKNKIETEFLFEKIMGCGLGLCYSCAIKIYKNNQIKYILTCKDGPVFSGDEIVWD